MKTQSWDNRFWLMLFIVMSLGMQWVTFLRPPQLSYNSYVLIFCATEIILLGAIIYLWNSLQKQKELLRELSQTCEQLRTANANLTDRLQERTAANAELQDRLAASIVDETKQGEQFHRLINALQPYSTIFQILQSQLQNVVQGTEDAAAKIVMQASDLKHFVNDLVKDLTLRMTEADKLCSHSLFSPLENAAMIDSLDKFAKQRSANLEQDNEQYSIIVSDTKSLARQIQSIEGITFQTKLLGLNASIEAAQAGEQGRGFGIIAQQVTRLATESRLVADEVEQGIAALSKSIESRLEQRASQQTIESANERATLEQLSAQLTNLGQQYQILMREHSELLKLVTANHQQMALKMMDLLASIQFQDIARQQVTQVINTLSRQDQYLEALTHPDKQTADVSETAMDATALINDYVMDEQRIAHHEVIGDSVAIQPDAPRIELF